ncbi:MAG: hypothetical protein JEY71_12465 [Sphaerochaeta sp.]|nr:hypothetical protein [Sphaerochaeta sp.]
MKKCILLTTFIMLIGFSILAQGNVEIIEKTTSLEGTIELIQTPGDKPTVYLIQDDGTRIEIVLPEGAVAQLQLRNQERVKIEGIFLGATTQNKVQEKLFARLVIRNQERIQLDDPIQLSDQEKTQLRTYQQEQLQTQKQLQQSNPEQNSQNQTGTNSNAGEKSGGNKK